MESKRKVISSMVVATIAVLLAAYFATPAFAACKAPPAPSPSVEPLGDVTTNGLPLSRMMLQDGFVTDEGCIGSSCSADDACCSGCLCIPIIGRPKGICIGLCCIFPEPTY